MLKTETPRDKYLVSFHANDGALRSVLIATERQNAMNNVKRSLINMFND